jgi:hypothetical protein
MKNEHEEIDVRIVYPSAHKPAEKKFSPETTIRQVKDFALDAFGLKEGPVDGNQVVFFLFHDRTKLENLDQPLSALVEKNQHNVTLRLAKEVVAG